ncbi:MAG: nuclear transport factor 2 family protein [bacterium]
MNLTLCTLFCLAALSTRSSLHTDSFESVRTYASGNRHDDPATTQRNTTTIDSATDSTIARSEHALWEAYRLHSRSQLSSLLAPSFLNVDSGGETKRAEILKGLDNYHITSISVQVIEVIQLSQTVTLVRAHVKATHDWKGHALPGDLMTSTVWTLTSGRVQALYHQDTPRT